MQTENKSQSIFDGDNLLNQITNISKAHAYDILADQVKELKEQNTRLRELLEWAHKVINASVPKQSGYGAIEILPQIETALNQL